eukprot:4794710-Pleurochrysis_carterae.AAC.1
MHTVAGAQTREHSPVREDQAEAHHQGERDPARGNASREACTSGGCVSQPTEEWAEVRTRARAR